MLHGVDEEVGHEIMGILSKLVPGDPKRQRQQNSRGREVGGNAGYSFRERKDSLEPQAHLKGHRKLPSVKKPSHFEHVIFAGLRYGLDRTSSTLAASALDARQEYSEEA